MISEIDTLGFATTFQYDAIGNLTAKLDRDGRLITYDYDHLDRMTFERWYDTPSDFLPSRTLTYQYDLRGRLTGTSDPAATYTYAYDTLDRTTVANSALPELPTVALTNSSYDNNGNRLELRATIGGTADFVNSYTYDDLGRLTELSQFNAPNGNFVAQKTVGLAYRPDNSLARISRFGIPVSDPNGQQYDAMALAISTFQYDAKGHITDINHQLQDGAQRNHHWTYAATIDRAKTYFNSYDNATITYGYDRTNQLVSESGPVPSAYQYDAGGNRTTIDGQATTVGPLNRLLADDRYTYTYDYEGNLIVRHDTQAGRTLYLFWDHRNRLTGIREWSGPSIGAHETFELTYEYDVFDRRVSRRELERTTVDGGEGGSTTIFERTAEKYIYDGDHVVLDFVEGPGDASYQLAHRYLYGPAVDQVLAQENVGTPIDAADRVYWFLTDNLGTVRDIVNQQGHAVAGGHYQYTAFGQLLAGDTALTRYLYTGREFDATTGLQYNRARWYDPHSGRFLSEDPIKDGNNWYAYAGSNPTNGTDPSGLAPIGKAAKTLKRGLQRLGVSEYFQIHHIIGRSILSDAKYAKWFARIGVDPNSAKNLIALPNNVISRVLSGRSLHNGRHLATM